MPAGHPTRVEETPLDRARQVISCEIRQKTGLLDLANLGLTELPDELWQTNSHGISPLDHIRVLNLGQQYFDASGDLVWTPRKGPANGLEEKAYPDAPSSWAIFSNLRSISVGGTAGDDGTHSLAVIPALPEGLHYFSCSNTQVADLEPLRRTRNLIKLNCASTSCSSLAPLSDLPGLTYLDCSYTQCDSSALEVLHSRPALEFLNCSSTQIYSLAFASNLRQLRTLKFSFCYVEDLSPLQGLSSLRTVICNESQACDDVSLGGLDLVTVNCADTGIGLDQFRGSKTLQYLDCSKTDNDPECLHELPALTTLICRSMQVGWVAEYIANLPNPDDIGDQGALSDLEAIRRFPRLKTLDCSHNEITDLSPVEATPNLKRLNCASNRITDLTPLLQLQSLATLDCSANQITSFEPLRGLDSLLEFHSADNPVDS